jgi:FlaA1/EpsC-like NDP-sugar epimerase
MRRPFLLTCWLITDAVLFIGTYTLAYFLRVGLIFSTDFPIDLYLRTVLAVAPLWLATLMALGVFELTAIQSSLRNVLHMFAGAIIGLAFFALAYYFTNNRFFSRKLLVYSGVLSFIFPLIWHLAFDQWQRRIYRKLPAAFPLLMIGINRETERFIKLLEERQSPFRPVAILDPQGSAVKDVAGVPVLGKLNKLEETVKALKPTHLVQCSNLEHTINLMSVCRQHGMTYLLLPSVLGVVGAEETVESIEGQNVIAVK